MDVRCERCKTQYEIDDARISESGVTVQCTTCHHVFVVKKKALVVTVPVKPGQVPPGAQPPTPESLPPAIPPAMRPLSSPIGMPPPVVAAPPPEPEPPAASLPPSTGSREWRVRQAVGNVFTLKDLTTLQKWIVERKVSRDDEISITGDTWKRLGDIAELATFFQLVDEAQKAAVLQAQVNLGLASGVAPPPAAPPSPLPQLPHLPSPAPVATASTQPASPPAPASRLPLVLALLVVLLGGGGAGYYFLVEVPRREAEAQRVLAAKLEQERLEKERQEQERLEKERQEQERLEKERQEHERQEQLLAAQAAEAQLRADAGAAQAPSMDGGTPGASDSGASQAPVDAGTPGVKKPAPVRDFDYYMNQGDRLRERDRDEAALEAYAHAAELEPDRSEPYSGRGLALLDMGNAGMAEAEFKQALKLNPRYGEAIMGLAETYRSQGKKAEAIRMYERYLEILPNGPEASVARSAIERLKE